MENARVNDGTFLFTHSHINLWFWHDACNNLSARWFSVITWSEMAFSMLSSMCATHLGEYISECICMCLWYHTERVVFRIWFTCGWIHYYYYYYFTFIWHTKRMEPFFLSDLTQTLQTKIQMHSHTHTQSLTHWILFNSHYEYYTHSMNIGSIPLFKASFFRVWFLSSNHVMC